MTLKEIEQELEELEKHPPAIFDEVTVFGQKMIRISRIQFELIQRALAREEKK